MLQQRYLEQVVLYELRFDLINREPVFPKTPVYKKKNVFDLSCAADVVRYRLFKWVTRIGCKSFTVVLFSIRNAYQNENRNHDL